MGGFAPEVKRALQSGQTDHFQREGFYCEDSYSEGVNQMRKPAVPFERVEHSCFSRTQDGRIYEEDYTHRVREGGFLRYRFSDSSWWTDGEERQEAKSHAITWTGEVMINGALHLAVVKDVDLNGQFNQSPGENVTLYRIEGWALHFESYLGAFESFWWNPHRDRKEIKFRRLRPEEAAPTVQVVNEAYGESLQARGLVP